MQQTGGRTLPADGAGGSLGCCCPGMQVLGALGHRRWQVQEKTKWMAPGPLSICVLSAPSWVPGNIYVSDDCKAIFLGDPVPKPTLEQPLVRDVPAH